MILKIVPIILLIAIIAGNPQKPPNGWPKGKPWPPGQHTPCICNPGPSTKPGWCFPKPKPNLPPKPKPQTKAPSQKVDLNKNFHCGIYKRLQTTL